MGREFDRQREASLLWSEQAHRGGDGRAGRPHLPLTGDDAQPVVEARGVAGSEELLGVGLVAAGAAHLLGDGEELVEHAVARADFPVAAVAGRDRLGGVERGHMMLPFMVGLPNWFTGWSRWPWCVAGFRAP
jgi:hypothetical protein